MVWDSIKAVISVNTISQILNAASLLLKEGGRFMADDVTFELLSKGNIADMALLGKEYNPKLTIHIIEEYLHELFSFNNYQCFGAFSNGKLIGYSSGWVTVKFTFGKLLEVDNVIINGSMQTREFGAKYFAFIESWAKKNNCKAIEIDTFLQSSRVHKFLINLDYILVGFHFQKLI